MKGPLLVTRRVSEVFPTFSITGLWIYSFDSQPKAYFAYLIVRLRLTVKRSALQLQS